MYIALSHIYNTVVKGMSSVRLPGLNPISFYLLQAILILDKLLYILCVYVCIYGCYWVVQMAKASACNAGDPGSIPWRREWQPTPVFLPGGFHGQGSLAGYSSRGRKGSDTTEQLTHYTYICTKYVYLCMHVYI